MGFEVLHSKSIPIIPTLWAYPFFTLHHFHLINCRSSSCLNVESLLQTSSEWPWQSNTLKTLPACFCWYTLDSCYLSTRRSQWHPTPVLLLENPMDGGAWWATVHGIAKSRTWLTHRLFSLEKSVFPHWSCAQTLAITWKTTGMMGTDLEKNNGELQSISSRRSWYDPLKGKLISASFWDSFCQPGSFR